MTQPVERIPGATLGDAVKNAEAKIQSKDDALAVAVEMLTAIKDGKSYGSFEYLTLLQRMQRYTRKPLDVSAGPNWSRRDDQPREESPVRDDDNQPDDEFSGDRDLGIGEADDEVKGSWQ
jgi:hypothetical protein